jgi:hypothetical protein
MVKRSQAPFVVTRVVKMKIRFELHFCDVHVQSIPKNNAFWFVWTFWLSIDFTSLASCTSLQFCIHLVTEGSHNTNVYVVRVCTILKQPLSHLYVLRLGLRHHYVFHLWSRVLSIGTGQRESRHTRAQAHTHVPKKKQTTTVTEKHKVNGVGSRGLSMQLDVHKNGGN